MTGTMEWSERDLICSTDKTRLQPSRIHQFLSTQAYWCIGISRDIVERAIAESLCFGLYDQSHGRTVQIGFARVVGDRATFAWICDVYIESDYRKQGLGKWLMACLMSHPDLKNLRRICLATSDAHSLYQQFGFEVTQAPQNWMEIKDDDLYKKMKPCA